MMLRQHRRSPSPEQLIEPVPLSEVSEVDPAGFLLPPRHQQYYTAALGVHQTGEEATTVAYPPSFPYQGQRPAESLVAIGPTTESFSPLNDERISHSARTHHHRHSSTRAISVDEPQKGNNFRSHQAESWQERFSELSSYREKHGNCLVPNAFKQNTRLAEWVKRQRYQYKLKSLGQHNSMTDERIRQLESLGFVWNSHDQTWEERFNELLKFKRVKGHCDVPSGYKPNPQLAIWVKVIHAPIVKPLGKISTNATFILFVTNAAATTAVQVFERGQNIHHHAVSSWEARRDWLFLERQHQTKAV